MANNLPKLMLTGGGSGGHLNAAIGVIKQLQVARPELAAKLVFVGGRRGMIGDTTPSLESRKIPELGVRFIAIRSGKFHRKLSLTTIKLLAGVVGGLVDAWRVLRREHPDLVFSTGGYVSLPVVIAARLNGSKVVIHEQTIVSGLANRIAAKFAHKVLISFADSRRYFPVRKTVLTGNPLQANRFEPRLPQVLPADYRAKLEAYKEASPGRPFIFITGGGLGSHIINTWVAKRLSLLTSRYNILLQTGENQLHDDFGQIKQLLTAKPELTEHFHLVKWFGDEVGFIYANADLVIGRPGANTVLELLATNKRALLIPIPWSAANEQGQNAAYFCSQQTGEVIEQAKLDSDLLPAIAKILKQPVKDSASQVDRQAAKRIVEEILELS